MSNSYALNPIVEMDVEVKSSPMFSCYNVWSNSNFTSEFQPSEVSSIVLKVIECSVKRRKKEKKSCVKTKKSNKTRKNDDEDFPNFLTVLAELNIMNKFLIIFIYYLKHLKSSTTTVVITSFPS